MQAIVKRYFALRKRYGPDLTPAECWACACFDVKHGYVGA